MPKEKKVIVAKRPKKKPAKSKEQFVTSAGAWVKTPKQRDDMFQTVTLEFEDGTKGSFTGPAVLFDAIKEVTNITFSQPQKLPADCSWGNL